MNTQLLRTNTVHNYCKPLPSQDHLFVNHNDWILVLFPHMNWPVADENGPMLCQIEIPQSRENGYKLSAQRLLGSFGWALMIGFVNGCLENHLPSKTNACCPKDSIFTAPKAGLYLGTRLLLLPAITKLGRKLDQNSSPKKVPGCNRKQNRSSLKRKFKMAKWARAS